MSRSVFSVAVLLLVALVALPDPASAQRLRIDRIRHLFDRDAPEIGVLGGPNRNTVTGAGSVDARFRGTLGGYLSVPIVGGLRIRPEVAVSGKQVGYPTTVGDSCTGICPEPGGQEIASFTWLELPILFEARFRRALGDWGTPRLYAGPFVAVRVGCSLSVPVPLAQPAGGDPQAPRLVESCGGPQGPGLRYHNGDAGFVVGGTLGAGPIGIGVRWTRSLVPIAPEQSVAGGSRLVGAKHSTLAVTLELGTKLR